MENKEKLVSWDWLSREGKIKRIYEVIWWSKFYDKYWLSWHDLYIIHIWDVIQYANIVISENSNKEDYTDEIENVEKDILWLYRFYTKPIEEQTDDCLDYVYSLLETNQPITS